VVVWTSRGSLFFFLVVEKDECKKNFEIYTSHIRNRRVRISFRYNWLFSAVVVVMRSTIIEVFIHTAHSTYIVILLILCYIIIIIIIKWLEIVNPCARVSHILIYRGNGIMRDNCPVESRIHVIIILYTAVSRRRHSVVRFF